jgi:hypothetical protein
MLAAMGVFHWWWLHCTGGGCVTPVVVVELSVVSLGRTYRFIDIGSRYLISYAQGKLC